MASRMIRVDGFDFARLYVLQQAGPSSSRVPSRTSAHRVYSAPTDRSTGICDQTISLDGFYTRQDYPELLRRIRGPRVRQDAGLQHRQLLASGRHHLRATKAAGRSFFKWIKQHLRIKQFYGTSENAVKTQIDCRLGHTSRRHRQERLDRRPLHFVTDPLGDPLRIHQALAGDNRCNASQITNQLFAALVNGGAKVVHGSGGILARRGRSKTLPPVAFDPFGVGRWKGCTPWSFIYAYDWRAMLMG